MLVPGSFDLLHHGHILMLQRSAQLGNVVVALGTDKYQTSYKRKPVQPYYLRAATLKALGLDVIKRPTASMHQIFMDLDPDYLVRGSDWRDNKAFLDACGIWWPFLEKHGVTLVVVPNEGYTSTTQIIQDVIRSQGE